MWTTLGDTLKVGDDKICFYNFLCRISRGCTAFVVANFFFIAAEFVHFSCILVNKIAAIRICEAK